MHDASVNACPFEVEAFDDNMQMSIWFVTIPSRPSNKKQKPQILSQRQTNQRDCLLRKLTFVKKDVPNPEQDLHVHDGGEGRQEPVKANQA